MLRHATRYNTVLTSRPFRSLPAADVCWQCRFMSSANGTPKEHKGAAEGSNDTSKAEKTAAKAKRKAEARERHQLQMQKNKEAKAQRKQATKRATKAKKTIDEGKEASGSVVRRVGSTVKTPKIIKATVKSVGKSAVKLAGSSLSEAVALKREEIQKHKDVRAKLLASSQPLVPSGMKQIDHGKTMKVEGDINPVDIKGQSPVRQLAHGLDRVLFNPGVFYLQDPRTQIYNFDPYLQSIMPVGDFDFDAITSYITSSKDKSLEKIAREHGKSYIGSTSSMTSSLSHLHFLISNWRPLNFGALSKSFRTVHTKFTEITRGPSSIFLRYKGDGVYAIDADKEFDTESVFSLLGQSLEKLLTSSPEDFELYRKGNSHNIAEEERSRPETYHYSTYGDFLMRSQLDAHDDRLPGSGMFDLKTRAVVSVRMDAQHIELGSGYQIKTLTGDWESFEREYFDLIRSAFLKYSLQARMGRMDGIFLTYHNTEKIFGFQYVPLEEMDIALHGKAGETEETSIGGQEFRMSLNLMNKLLNMATKKFPEQSLRIYFETRPTSVPMMYFFAEPMTEAEIELIQEGEKGEIKGFIDEITGKLRKPGPVIKETAEKSTEGEVFAAREATEESEKSPEAVKEETATIATEIEQMPPREAEHVVDDADSALVAEAKSHAEAATEEVLETGALSGTGKPIVFDSATLTAETTTPEESSATTEEPTPETPELSAADIIQQAADSRPPQPAPQPDKPLLGVALTIRNYVNGQPVHRVSSLSDSENWTLEYSISELGNPWATYMTVKGRKRQLFGRAGVPDDDTKIGPHIAMLRRMSAAGRKFEQEKALKEVGKPKLVFKSKSEKLDHYLSSYKEAVKKAQEEIKVAEKIEKIEEAAQERVEDQKEEKGE